MTAPASPLRDATRRARARLEADASETLERRHGWRRDGGFDGARPEASAERARLERFADERRAAGEAPDAARRRLCGGAAFVHLHALVARRMTDARGLAPPSADELSRLLASPDDPAALLAPGASASEAVFREIEAAPGSAADDALGSVFRHFAESDRDEPAILRRTRLYTPRWISEFLVENTLGRIWLEMRPDSRLAERMRWLVPRPARRAEPRLARDIRFLEPACGALAVGIVAFDLLHAMHVEEIERAGEPGWPAVPSVADPALVPESIAERNIAGFDLDPRAVRLAVLGLAIAARTKSPSARIGRHGLAAVDPPLGTLGRDPRIDGPFDAIATNPPYLDRSDSGEALRSALDERFPEAKRNLYAAFIADSLGRLRDGGRLGVVTPQSFLFVSSFEKFRRSIRSAAAMEALAHTGLATFPDAMVDCALSVFRRGPAPSERGGAEEETTAIRLLASRSPEEKARSLARALASLRAGARSAAVHRVRASDCDAVPGAPFVYWARPAARRLFRDLPALAAIASPRQGLATTDNERFVRCFWEVGHARVAWGCRSREDAAASGRRFFPYMKGGAFRRFYGNQELVVDWGDDGAAIKKAIAAAYPYLGGRSEWVAKNSSYYFKPGITYSYLTSGPFSARLMPPGFVFDVAGSALFPGGGARRRLALLALLNSKAAAHLLSLVNPTVNFQVGDLARIPVPARASERLARLAREAVALARESEAERETSPEFVAPPEDAAAVRARAERLGAIDRAIDDEAFRLYGISGRDRAAVEREAIPAPFAALPGEAEIAWRWISYAAGIAIARFRPGAGSAPGRGRATFAEAAALRALAARDGWLSAGDLAARAWRALVLLRGESRAAADVATALEPAEAPAAALERHFAGGFHERHAALHRNRPPLVLLRPPRRGGLSFFVFHEWLDRGALEGIERALALRSRRGGAAEADAEFAAALRLLIESGSATRRRLDFSIPAAIEALAPLAAPPPGAQRSRRKTSCVLTRENPSRS